MKVPIVSVLIFITIIKAIVVDVLAEKFQTLDGMGFGINYASGMTFNPYPTAPYQRITQTNVSTIKVEYSVVNSAANPNLSISVKLSIM